MGPLHRDRSLTRGSLWDDIKQELGRNDAEDEDRLDAGRAWGSTEAVRHGARSWRAENRTATRQAAKVLIRENLRHMSEGTRGGIEIAQGISQRSFARLGSKIESVKANAKLSTHWQPGDEV